MTRDSRWPYRLSLSARTAQFIVAIAFSIICGTTLRYVISSSLSLVTILYLLIVYWCLFTSRLNPTVLVGVEFLLVFLWGVATCSVLLLGEPVPRTLVVAAVGLLEMMLLVGTTAMAAAVMYRCRWEEEGVDEEVVGEEEAALPDIMEAGVNRCGAVESAAAGETAAELPVMKAEISAAGETVAGAGGETAAEIPVMKAAAGEAVAEIPVVGEVARES